MNIVNKFRKPSLSIILASLVLFVSCEQYDHLNNELLDQQTIEAIQKATLDFVNDTSNGKSNVDENSVEVDPLINEAISLYFSDDLETFKENVVNYANWSHDQLVGIEASFVVMETLKDDFESNQNSRSAWWAPLGYAGICLVVGLLSLGVAGAACGILFAAGQAAANYQQQ